MTKRGNDRYIYTMFDKILPPAFNLSSMYKKISSNFLREFRTHKRKLSFSRTVHHSN